jgi:hypothetical protein
MALRGKVTGNIGRQGGLTRPTFWIGNNNDFHRVVFSTDKRHMYAKWRI